MSMWDTMLEYTSEKQTGAPIQEAPESDESIYKADILFVATNLDSWEADDVRFGYEVMLDVCYRQLDASYYAYLRHKMTQAKERHDSGKMKPQVYEELRTRFNTIHEWAATHIGEKALRQAMQTASVKSYVPPSEQTFTAYRKAQEGSPQSDQARKLEHALATRGYACIMSAIIKDIVIFVRDDSVVVPDKWADKVRFTMDELALMVGSSPEAVKQIYEVKRVFGGKVVPSDDDPFGAGMTGPVPVAADQRSLFTAATGTK